MTHLRILQSDSATEQVSSAVISKLYELASNNTFDNTSDLVGRLSATAAYADEVSWLTLHYLNLYITANKLYIRFEDPVTELICVTNFSSDGVGCTPEDLAVVTETLMGNISFSGITKFNEFQYFTGVHSSWSWFKNNTTLEEITLPNTLSRIGSTTGGYGSGFFGCTALKSIIISDNCSIAPLAFNGCTSLTSVYFGHNCNTTGAVLAFRLCTSLNTLVLNEINELSTNMFELISLSGTITIPNSVTFIGQGVFDLASISKILFEPGGISPLVMQGSTSGYRPGCFRWLTSLNPKRIVLPERLSEVKNNALGYMNSNTKIDWVFTSTTPPSVTGDLGYLNEGTYLYVPNSAVATYLATTGFTAVSSQVVGYKIYQCISSTWSEVSNPTEVLIMSAADNLLSSIPDSPASDGSLALVTQS